MQSPSEVASYTGALSKFHVRTHGLEACCTYVQCLKLSPLSQQGYIKSSAMGVPPEVQQILDKHAARFSVTAEGKVKCELNGHTFPARADALNAFIK
jgi:hypothetical protein